MSCMILIGGIIGCGKTTFIDYCLKREKQLFQKSDINDSPTYSTTDSKSCLICKIAFDDLCSIQEQAELMKTLKGLRNFRVDLLFAAEYFISLASGSECRLAGPLSERSQKLLNKIVKLNDFSSPAYKVLFMVEDNFYYRSMRHEWFQIARRANIGFCQIFLQSPLNTAIQRNASRGYNIPEQKIRMMIDCMETPNTSKFKWERYSIIIDSSTELKYSLKEIANLISDASSNPAELIISEEKIKAQIVCSKNVIHQADKILRKLISSKISHWKDITSDADTLKGLATSAIDIRQDVLNDLRQGSVDLSEDLICNLQKSGIESVKQEYEEHISNLFERAWHASLGNLDTKFSNLNVDDDGKL